MALPHGLRIALNMLFHVGVLLLVLCVLRVVLVHHVVQGEFQSLVAKALIDADQQSGGKLRAALRPAAAGLRRLRPLYEKDDQSDRWFNDRPLLLAVVGSAGMLLTACFAILGTYAVLSKKFCASCSTLGTILAENALMFALIVLVECVFFEQVESKFVPAYMIDAVMPKRGTKTTAHARPKV
jgi:hypothetical protein